MNLPTYSILLFVGVLFTMTTPRTLYYHHHVLFTLLPGIVHITRHTCATLCYDVAHVQINIEQHRSKYKNYSAVSSHLTCALLLADWTLDHINQLTQQVFWLNMKRSTAFMLLIPSILINAIYDLSIPAIRYFQTSAI